MKTISTAFTRPRSSSGVTSGQDRLPQDDADHVERRRPTASATSESHIDCERPKTTMRRRRRGRPPSAACARRGGATGRRVRITAETARRPPARRAGAPRPAGPTWSTSFAKTGSSATAPPKRTAKRSSEMAPEQDRRRRTSRTPPSTLARSGDEPPAGSRPARSRSTPAERDDRERRRDRVDELLVEREQEAAERRPDDHGRLQHDGAEGERAHEDRARDERRGHRA